jgi:hypothetical protein
MQGSHCICKISIQAGEALRGPFVAALVVGWSVVLHQSNQGAKRRLGMDERHGGSSRTRSGRLVEHPPAAGLHRG